MSSPATFASVSAVNAAAAVVVGAMRHAASRASPFWSASTAIALPMNVQPTAAALPPPQT